jgi:hypothetical protein
MISGNQVWKQVITGGTHKKKPLQKVAEVPRTGIEPAHCCQYQILSLTRLPVPPSGLKGGNIMQLFATTFPAKKNFLSNFQ